MDELPHATCGGYGGNVNVPTPTDPRKPTKLTDLDRRSWKFIAKKTFREFNEDQCLDLAAGLTFYAVLALFPALLALVALLGLLGSDRQGTNALMGMVREVAPGAADTMQSVVTQLTQSHATGFALVIGLAVALWSASGYIGAFGRALNRIYEIDEGRPFYKLRPMMLLITLVAVILAAMVALALVVSGPVATAVGNALGIGDTAVTIWNIIKWPVILAVVVAVVAILYYATPNIKQPKFRWISIGAALAVLVWVSGIGRFRLLRRPLRQLRQDVRLAGRRHRVPAVAVDHQPGTPVRRRGRLRDRTRHANFKPAYQPSRLCSCRRRTPRPARRPPQPTKRNCARHTRSDSTPMKIPAARTNPNSRLNGKSPHRDRFSGIDLTAIQISRAPLTPTADQSEIRHVERSPCPPSALIEGVSDTS